MHRICDRYDITLRDHFEDRSEEEYEALHRRVAVGVARARAELLERGGGPTDVTQLALSAHRLMFTGVFDFAGRVRQKGERVAVGQGENELVGVEPSEIDEALARLGATVQPIDSWPVDRRQFARRAACFLAMFFAIHPFADGNGRTARLIVECAAMRTGKLRIVRLDHAKKRHESRDQREYIRALEEAHKRAGRTRAHYALDLAQSTEPEWGIRCTRTVLALAGEPCSPDLFAVVKLARSWYARMRVPTAVTMQAGS